MGGTTQPENPKENTIWVNTDTAITGWAFSAEEPESPAEGMVWIITGTDSTVEFNALKKNGIRIYPISAKQYSAGVWNVKTAKSYINGEWAEWWNGDLFDYGDVFESVTGGYVAIAKPLTSGTNGYVPVITDITGGSRKIYPGGTNGEGGMYHTVNKINLSNYTTLKFLGRVVDSSGYGRSGIGVWSNIGAASDINLVGDSTGNDSSNVTRSIDVSKLTGEYYIGFYVFRQSYVIVAKMWLE
ncbi:MAG: hypothetical protein ACI4P4_07340 [Faecousia sp.]